MIGTVLTEYASVCYARRAAPLIAANRDQLWQVLGKVDTAERLAPNPRARALPQYSNSLVAAFEVVLDVFAAGDGDDPGVFAWGILLVPRDVHVATEGERRPVVVCQHGLEGLPSSCVMEQAQAEASILPGAFESYKAFAMRLAERGFITFSPHNPYRGGYSRGRCSHSSAALTPLWQVCKSGRVVGGSKLKTLSARCG